MAKVSVTKEKLDTLAGKIATKSGESTPLTIDEMGSAVDSIQTGGNLQTKSKTYTPTSSQQTDTILPDAGYDGMSEVQVTVGAAPAATPTVKTTTVSNSSSTATSLSFTGLTGEPVAFFVKCNSNISYGSTTYYYVANMRYNGSNVYGNCARMGSTRNLNAITSGYSQSYSNGTLTIMSTGSRTSSPGSFYNGTYELTYVY